MLLFLKASVSKSRPQWKGVGKIDGRFQQSQHCAAEKAPVGCRTGSPGPSHLGRSPPRHPLKPGASAQATLPRRLATAADLAGSLADSLECAPAVDSTRVAALSMATTTEWLSIQSGFRAVFGRCRRAHAVFHPRLPPRPVPSCAVPEALQGRSQPVGKVIYDLFPLEKPPVFSSATYSRLPRAVGPAVDPRPASADR